jgi:hypothetical protein
MHQRKSCELRDVITDATHFVPASHVTSTVHGTDTALLDMRSERYYTLGEVGSRIWALLASGCSMAEIAERLGEEFDASMTKIEVDLRALLARLEGAALIGRANDDSESLRASEP